jgi:ectoine hydroxylase-related dioxygenase (phytanoyl-CoA dioxygenase family)
MATHGHLFFPGLLPRDAVLEGRAEALALCRDAGWVDAQGGPLDARWRGGEPVREDDPRWTEFYRLWITSPVFQSLPEHPAIVAAAEKLLGGEVMVHPRKIGRVGFPQNEGQQTPPHQDFFHIHGTPETYTAWVPLGDCPMELGCLTVADGSHASGFREHTPSDGPGGWSVEADGDAAWCSQDFRAGDVLFVHSLTIHQALPNRTRDEVRVSIDNRYQRADDDIDPASLRSHI